MPGARWSQSRDGKVERTVLDEGTIALQVQKQHADEQFFVELPDGEIEVRGTTFEVTVREQVTTSIHVEEGLVVFRRPQASDVVLGQMETWRAAETTSPAAKASSRGRPSSESRLTAEYELAVAAYHAQQYADAAQRFAAFVASHPEAPEAEDAAFLEASALAHGGRTDTAAAAAERFLGRYPSSFHARDAAILVARDARDRGDCSRARRALQTWRSSPPPEIVSTLASCNSN
jgi:TolA-binding protein